MSQACTPTSLKKMGLKLYAKHTKHSIKKKVRYQPTHSKKCSYSRRIPSNLMEAMPGVCPGGMLKLRFDRYIISRLKAPQWVLKWQLLFMSAVEIEIIKTSITKPLEWKRYNNDVFSLWDTTKEEIELISLS